jgi:hypothetical protein
MHGVTCQKTSVLCGHGRSTSDHKTEFKSLYEKLIVIQLFMKLPHMFIEPWSQQSSATESCFSQLNTIQLHILSFVKWILVFPSHLHLNFPCGLTLSRFSATIVTHSLSCPFVLPPPPRPFFTDFIISKSKVNIGLYAVPRLLKSNNYCTYHQV